MDNGIKLRLLIHRILFEIKIKNKNLDNHSIQKKINRFNEKDRAFIYNVILNSMRYYFHITQILNLYLSKKPKLKHRLILVSAITQIVFLDFKEYAVINCSVEISKKLKLHHGFINASLKNIAKDKIKLKNTNIIYSDLPEWFCNETKDLNDKEKKLFIRNFHTQPNLHLIFKSSDDLMNFEEELIKTSQISGFLKKQTKIENLLSYKNGTWWVQDFSSFFPLSNKINYEKKKEFIDLCSAPGGKSFQILNENFKIILNDKNLIRIKKLRTNLKRLNFPTEISNYDVLKYDFKAKFDFVILDAPCSSIGTIRKNPEIFFKNKRPDIKNLIKLQEKLLFKSCQLLKNNGVLLYMVCSFLQSETTNLIKNFLSKNNNFDITDFKIDKKNSKYKNFIHNKFIRILPSRLADNNIDGYFAALIKKKN